MRLKHVLFSSLFLSAAFVACTNEDLVETQAPSMDVENAISLGEGFTITGTKMAMDPATKSIFEVNGGKLLPYWEEKDVVGAAWFNMVTGIDEATGMVTSAGEINNSYKFFSNTDFNWLEFVGGDKAQAKFEANTNVMAGAYVIYFPFDENVKQVSNEIPVKLEFPYTVNLAEGHEFDAVSENMFSYCVAAFVPGGRQTSYFETKQVPVLYRLKLGATNLKLVDLATDPLVIDRIIIEAEGANGTVLTTAGKVVPPSAIDEDDYNAYLTYVATDGEEGAPLPEAAYTSSTNTKDMVGHYTIELANSDQPAYQIAKLDELTTGNIAFSALPITEKADELTIKIVTKDGLNLVRKYTTGDDELEAFNAQLSDEYKAKPSVIKLDVFVDTQSNDEIIYTAGQFQAAWAEAIKSSTKENPATLTIADPVILKDVELVNDNPDAVITIQSEDGATLQVKSINWEEGKLAIKSNLTVDGDITNDANLTVENGAVTAKNITLNGNTTMTIAEMESLLVRSSGKVNLTLPADNAEKVGKITVRDGGELTLNGGYLGDVEIVEGKLNIAGGSTVYNTTSFTGTLSGETGAKFVNKAGATAALTSVDKVIIENEGETATEAAGVITTKGNISFVAGSENAGIINATAVEVNDKLTGTLTVTNLTQVGAEARVNIEKGVTIKGTNTGSEGLFVVKSEGKVDSKANISRLAYSIMTMADLTAAKDGCNYFIDADLKANTAPVKSTGTVYFNANQTLKGDWTMSVNVIIDEDVTFSTDVETGATYTQSTGTLTVNGSLYVKDGVTLNAGRVTAATFRNIDADDFDTQVQATVE